MNVFAISGLLIGLTGVFEALIIFLRGRKLVHYLWGAFCISFIVWGMGGYKIATTVDADEAIFWWKVAYIGVIFIPIFLAHFTYEFLNIKEKWHLVIFYFLGAFFLILNLFTNLFINKVRWAFNQFYYISSPTLFYTLFVLVFLGLVIICVFKFWQYYLVAQGIRRVQLRYILIALVIGFSGGAFSFLPVYKIELYPALNLTVSIGVVIVAYAIFRYRLMDVRILLREGFIYFGLALFTYLMFYFVVWAYTLIFGGIFNKNSYFTGLFIAPFFVAILYWVADHLRIIANRYFFTGLYNYQETIHKLTRELNYYNDLDKIIDILVETIKKTMQLNRAGVLLINIETKPIHYQIAKVVGFNEQNGISLVQDNFLTQYLEKTEKPLVREELLLIANDSKNKTEAQKLKNLYDHMQHIEASLCLPLISNKRLIGIIVLGSKVSSDAFTQEDLELLSTLSYQAGIAIDNARLYKEVKDFSKTLQQKVDIQTKDLKDQAEHLKKLLKMRSEFLDIASHQLKTPVSVILGTISMLQEGSIDKLPKEQQAKFIDNIFRKAQKLSTIINDILRASEMDTDEFSLVREAIKPTQIEEIISRVYEDLKPETDRKGLVFTIEKPKRPLPKILVDADFLEQAFYNLTDNAIKYTAKGFVKIVLNQESNQLVVKIQDSGVGIPLEDQKKIFDKFARAKNAIDMYTDGSGLGLFIVKKIIEAHQGAINFISKENEGTVFTVSLPVGSVGLKKVN